MILLLQTIAVFWNVENFFDYRECSEISGCRWTASRFYDKARGIGKIILSLSEGIEPPALVGLCEVDSKNSLYAITRSEVLEKWNYKFIHYDSPDPRGIDCALLYRGCTPRCSESIPLTMDGKTVPSRTMLKVEFDSLAVLVVHLPSKRGGSKEAARKRQRAVEMIDSIASASLLPLLVMGDFNEECGKQSPWSGDLKEIAGEGAGSIKFQGRWEKIDRVLFRDSSGKHSVRCKSAALEVLLCPDKNYGGLKPLRTCSGPQYCGGLSDHLPIRIEYDGVLE